MLNYRSFIALLTPPSAEGGGGDAAINKSKYLIYSKGKKLDLQCCQYGVEKCGGG